MAVRGSVCVCHLARVIHGQVLKQWYLLSAVTAVCVTLIELLLLPSPTILEVLSVAAPLLLLLLLAVGRTGGRRWGGGRLGARDARTGGGGSRSVGVELLCRRVLTGCSALTRPAIAIHCLLKPLAT